ncbi:MAG: hypothetical protein ACLGHI_07600 [Gammaproteobacteria bacterium]|jgi:hypothetical protein
MRPESPNDRAVVLFLLALGLLITPARLLWAEITAPWWLIYLLWGLLIAAIGWSVARGGDGT